MGTVQRIGVRKNWIGCGMQARRLLIPTKHLILTVCTSILSKRIKTGYIKIDVAPYIPNLRCSFKCQIFGHGSPSCRGHATCTKCASHDHLMDNCNHPPHCENCMFSLLSSEEEKKSSPSKSEKTFTSKKRASTSHLYRDLNSLKWHGRGQCCTGSWQPFRPHIVDQQ